MNKECFYMIHTCNNRKWYVEQYLIPSMCLQGINLDHIKIWLDKDNIGCLESCMQSFASLPEDGYTWHLQDDVIICSDFKQKTEEFEEIASIVCGYCYYRNTGSPAGVNFPRHMWYSFPCISISNSLAKECAEWYFKNAKYNSKYTKWVSTGKCDDSMFKFFCEEKYGTVQIVYNLNPNLVDHIDYLIGGSIVNKERQATITSAAYFQEPELIEQLKDKLEKKDLRVAAYCGTRNLYKDMIPAIKSLLVNSNVDKIYLLIEDDIFPYPLPPEVETINVSRQGFFKQNGPNMKSKFTYMVMMRPVLPFILPQYKKILSLDVDTIVDKDISAIWDIDLKDNYMAACIEPDKCIGGKYYQGGCRLYFNGGVVLYNCEQLKNRKGWEIIKRLNEQYYPFVEQDCMCEMCEGGILPLSNDYNYTPYSSYYICGKSFDPKIYHYAAIKKWQDCPEVIKYREMKIGNENFEFE